MDSLFPDPDHPGTFSDTSISASPASDLEAMPGYDLRPSAQHGAMPLQTLNEERFSADHDAISALPGSRLHDSFGEPPTCISYGSPSIWPSPFRPGSEEALGHYFGRRNAVSGGVSRASVDPLSIGPSGPIPLADGEGIGAFSHGISMPGNVHSADLRSDGSPTARSKSSSQVGSSNLATSPSETRDEDDDDHEDDDSDSESDSARKKGSPAFRPRGRKKRNKCSPEQLQSLEAFFSKNRNPTGKVREELSKRLKMPERSVQVWFQNRRAKVKTLERRGLDPELHLASRAKRTPVNSEGSDKSQDTPRARTTTKASTSNSKQEAPSVTALPTTALCIGTWRRVSPLVCFFSRRLQMLSWYLSSESIGFKLEMPWTSIKSAYFDGPTQPTLAEKHEGVRHPLGHFLIELSRPPTFFMEVFRSVQGGPEGDDKAKKTTWRQCSDFTEGQQGTTHRIHILSGPYEELRAAVVSFAQSNEALEKLVQFKDASRRSAGGDAGELTLRSEDDTVGSGSRELAEAASMQGSQALAQPSGQRAHQAGYVAGLAPSWHGPAARAVTSGEAGFLSESYDSQERLAAAMQRPTTAYSMGSPGNYPSVNLRDGHNRGVAPRSPFSPMDLNAVKVDSSDLANPLHFPRVSEAALGVAREAPIHGMAAWEASATSAPSHASMFQWSEPMERYPTNPSFSTPASAMAFERSYPAGAATMLTSHLPDQEVGNELSSSLGPSGRRLRPFSDETLCTPMSMARYPLAGHGFLDQESAAAAQIHPALATNSDGGSAGQHERPEYQPEVNPYTLLNTDLGSDTQYPYRSRAGPHGLVGEEAASGPHHQHKAEES